MKRGWGILALVLVTAGVAHAQPVAVATTDPEGEAAAAELRAMLGDEGQRAAPPADTAGFDTLSTWTLPDGARLGVLIALGARRLFVVVPAEGRTLERVLPAELQSTDAFAIALSASELLELAGWSVYDAPAPLAEAPAPEGPRTPDAPNGDDDAADASPDETGESSAARGRFVWGLSAGTRFGLGLDGSLPRFDARLAVDLSFPDVSLGPSHPFVELALRGPGRDVSERALDEGALTLRYHRPGVSLRGGLVFAIGTRLSLRPFVGVGLDVVRVDATFTPRNGPTDRGRDVRVAMTGSAGAELRASLGARWFLATSLALDAWLGATPYTVYGERVLDEPAAEASAHLAIGVRSRTD